MPDYFVHIDTRLADGAAYGTPENSSYTVSLNEPFTGVKEIALHSLELPHTVTNYTTSGIDDTFSFILTVLPTTTVPGAVPDDYGFTLLGQDAIQGANLSVSDLLTILNTRLNSLMSAKPIQGGLVFQLQEGTGRLQLKSSIPRPDIVIRVLRSYPMFGWLASVYKPASETLLNDVYTGEGAMDVTHNSKVVFLELSTLPQNIVNTGIYMPGYSDANKVRGMESSRYVHRKAFARIPLDVEPFSVKYVATVIPGTETFKWQTTGSSGLTVQQLRVVWRTSTGQQAAMGATHHSMCLRIRAD